MLYEVNPDALKGEITRLGVYRPSVSILADKGRVLALKVTDVRTPAANIIKQEMLAAGGDCATPGTAITCAVPRVDIILLGGRKQYDILLYKMRQMPYFGIPAVVAELERYLRKGPKGTLLADGRRLTYDRMAVMGILNVTPDSFYAGSRRQGTDAVLAQAERMLSRRKKNGPASCRRWSRSNAASPKPSCPSTPTGPPWPGKPWRSARTSSTISAPCRRTRGCCRPLSTRGLPSS